MSENEKAVEQKAEETKKKAFSLPKQDFDYVEEFLKEGEKQGYTQGQWLVETIRSLRKKQDDSILDLEAEIESISRYMTSIGLILDEVILKAQNSVKEERDLDYLELSELESQNKKYKEKVLELSELNSLLEKENAQIESELNSQLKLGESRIEELEKMIGLLQQTNDEKEKVIELLQQKSDEKDKMLEEVNARFQEEKAEKNKILQEEKSERIKLQEQLVGLVKEKIKEN